MNTAPRHILHAFSYLERIGKGARTSFWSTDPHSRIALHDMDYAAIREYLVCIEANNLAIYDMKVEDMSHAMRDRKYMRSVGYRVVLVTAGTYGSATDADEETALDARLRTEIAQLIDIKQGLSAVLSAEQQTALETGSWKIEEALPSVVKNLGTQDLFGKRSKSRAGQEAALLDLVARMKEPQTEAGLSHKVEIGLALPELIGRQQWIYLVKSEHSMSAFENALATCLGGLAPECPRHHHMQGHGRWASPEARQQETKIAAFVKGCNGTATTLPPYRQPLPELRPR